MTTILFGVAKVIVGFSDVFSKRIWPMVQVLLTGAILTVGPRTVTAVLRAMALVAREAIPEIPPGAEPG